MAKSSSSNTRLVFEDFRPIRKGEGGYSSTKRNYISPSTGEVISLRQFQKQASRVPYVPPPKKEKPRKTSTPVKPTGKVTGTGQGKRPTIYVGNVQPKLKLTQAEKIAKYYSIVDRYVKNVNEKTQNIPGFVPLTRDTARQSSEFKMYYKAYKNYKDRKKGGLRHQALLLFGYLEETDDYY